MGPPTLPYLDETGYPGRQIGRNEGMKAEGREKMYEDLYSAEWGTKARVKDALVEAEEARLARQAGKPGRPQRRHQRWTLVLGRLVSSLGYAWG
jgi:hypothetical protein